MTKIAGIEKASLLDYPGKVCAVLFTHGCNLRCPYCHNPELVIQAFEEEREVTKKYLLSFLKNRVGKLDAVVITGGEPLLHDDIGSLIGEIKKLGFLIKLDTNGFYPSRLERIIQQGNVDYIAMDVKYPKSEYIKFSGKRNAESKISKSINLILSSGIDYEFRTTYVKGIHNVKSVEGIGKLIEGAKRYYIQNFRAGKTLNPSLSEKNAFTEKELKAFKAIMKRYVKKVYIR